MRPYDQHSHQDDADDSDADVFGPGKGLTPSGGWWWRRGGRGPAYHPGRGGRGRGGCSKPTVRLARLAAVCLLCPAILLGWPLYMRYFVLRDLVLPLAPSDMRVLDLQMSTTWCQAQVVRANATFNAWVVGGRPRRGRRQRVSLVRDIRLDDDMKEYWGFYLLEGSSFTVSPCARWPGVSLVVIRGYDHLQQCAYIGDDSSEEVEEVRRAALRRQLEEGRRLRPSSTPPAPEDPTRDVASAASPSAARPGDVPPAEAAAVSSIPVASTAPASRARPSGPGPAATAAPTAPAAPRGSTDGGAAQATTKRRSNLPKRMHLVKEPAVEFHEKTRPPAKLFNKFDGLDEEPESSPEAGGSAELARGMLERLRALGATGQRALDRLRTGRLARDLARDERDDPNTAAEKEQGVEPAPPPGLPAGPAPGEDVHGWVNETTSLDESHSELWSSFSSSEEALLGCAGLVLNLPLTPHRLCQRRRPVDELSDAAAANVITYRVPADGHYFFVLGSENEVQTNFVRVRFDLDKVVYDVDSPLAECGGADRVSNTSATATCSLPLRFLSDDTLVLEVPVQAEEGVTADLPSLQRAANGVPQPHLDHVVAVSTCEPRTALYVACVLALPAIILTCAF